MLFCLLCNQATFDTTYFLKLFRTNLRISLFYFDLAYNAFDIILSLLLWILYDQILNENFWFDQHLNSLIAKNVELLNN